jgi:hypothetical protein
MPFKRGDPKPAGSGRTKKPATPRIEVVYRPVAWFQPYERNPRKNVEGRTFAEIKAERSEAVAA